MIIKVGGLEPLGPMRVYAYNDDLNRAVTCRGTLQLTRARYCVDFLWRIESMRSTECQLFCFLLTLLRQYAEQSL